MSSDGTRRDAVVALMRDGQRGLVAELEACDGVGAFTAKDWHRPGGGGGEARIMQRGRVFERAGVNVSAVHGDRLPAGAVEHGQDSDAPFFATGLSVVVHPANPFVPSMHANFRYFEMGHGTWWFGGGADLTPAYGFVADAVHFHRVLKECCDTFDPTFYATAKAACDRYFHLPHRAESRGVGGIFFDQLRPTGPDGWQRALGFVRSGIAALGPAYFPIVARRMDVPYGDRERQWQLHRRGRYVEFNLVYDRGTRFGLHTGGYAEAVLMSLPPLAAWSFDVRPEPDSPEARTLRLLQPWDWLANPPPE